MENLGRTGDSGSETRNIEAAETEFDHMRWIGIVAPHPYHKLAIGLEPAEAVTNAKQLHRVVK
jgi:hypothetical protein